jgi:glycosyltransferase involved in cell wall biosynthesis
MASPEVVIVTIPYFTVAPIVLELAAQDGLPCVVDFRDAWSQWCTNPRMTWFHHQYVLSLERKCLKKAARVTGVTKQVLEDLMEHHPMVPRSKFVVVANGTDAPLLPFQGERRCTGKYVIGYVGRFYYDPVAGGDCMRPFYQRPLHRWFQYVPRREDWKYRSPYFFFRALARLLARRPDLRGAIEVAFAGDAEPWLGSQIAEFALGDVVTHLGRMEHIKCLEFQRNCDALLLTSVKVPGGRDYCIAGKTFEYLLTGRPVIGFVAEGEQRDFLRGSGVALVCDPDDPEGASRVLEKALDGRINLRRNEGFLSKYTRRMTVQHNLLGCLMDLLSESDTTR